MKKFVNDPRTSSPRCSKGIALANPDTIKYVPEYNLIMRTDAPSDDKVSIVQGSGSGPRAGPRDDRRQGDARRRVPGRRLRRAADGLRAGRPPSCSTPRRACCYIINNYTGDRMAFDMGREMAEAEGVKIGTVIVDDDVAVKDSTCTVGRRGVAGNFFVIKAVGAATGAGRRARRLVPLGERVNSVSRTMGMALTSCTPPAKGSPLFDLGDDEMEMGVGIHGEPGRRREKLASRRTTIVDELLEAIVDRPPFKKGDNVALMINGLGGTPISELYILYGRAHEQLADRGINVGGTTSASTARRSTWPGPRSPSCGSTTSSSSLLDAPAEIPIRTF